VEEDEQGEAEVVCAKWKPWTRGEPTLEYWLERTDALGVIFDKPSGNFEVVNIPAADIYSTYHDRPDKVWYLGSVISSAMLLYRLCCLWPVNISTDTDRYKWE
jgi:hypothetical protein